MNISAWAAAAVAVAAGVAVIVVLRLISKRFKAARNGILYVVLSAVAVVFLAPVAIILLNSFKNKLYILDNPFSLPDSTTWTGLDNYIEGVGKTGFLSAVGWSFFITIVSVGVIVLCTSMCAWYITRVKNRFNSFLYYLFVFSMIVPFQMVMFTMSYLASKLHLSNPYGIVFIYLGFGAGLSVFMFSGFVKSIPVDIEEAAMIDGCSPIQTYFRVVFPILRPTAVTVAILNAMWIWNDYLLPSLILDTTKYRTIPIAVQMLRGSYGAVDWGHMMAMIILAIVPIIVFYLTCQKYIIEGVVAGAVKG